MNKEQEETSDLNESSVASAADEDSLYRPEAVAEYAEAQQSYHLTQVIAPRAWIVMVVLTVCLMAVLAWFFFGTVVTRITGQGILTLDGAQIHSVNFEGTTGQITSVNVISGQQVTKGQVLGVVNMPELADQVKPAQQLTDKIKEQYDALQKKAAQSINIRTQEWTDQRELLSGVLANDQAQSQQVHSLLSAEEKASVGIVSRRDLIATKLQYSQLQQSVLSDKKALSDLDIQFAAYKDDWNSQLRALRLQLAQQTESLRVLQNTLRVGKTLTSPVDGTVFWILVSAGDPLKEGQSLFYIAPTGKFIAQGYIPASQGKMIQVGMNAEVVPSFTQPLEYGSITGKVVQISPGLESAESMSATLKDPNLIKQFLSLGPVVAVKIQLNTNANNFSGFDWTASSGPDIHLTLRTLVNVSVLVEQQHPVSFILPRIEKLAHV